MKQNIQKIIEVCGKEDPDISDLLLVMRDRCDTSFSIYTYLSRNSGEIILKSNNSYKELKYDLLKSFLENLKENNELVEFLIEKLKL